MEETKQKIRILLVDDHFIVRQGIRRIFEAEPDFEVVGEAENGEEAVRLASQLSPNIIVMGARISRMNSVEATKRVKAQRPDASVLVLTSHDEENYIVELLRAGAAGCLLKSANGEQLVQAIRSINKGVLVLDPTVEQRILNRVSKAQPLAIDFGQHLTPREFEVLTLAAKRMSNRNIARHLGLTEGTVKGYVVNIFGKMGVNSRTEAVLEALKRGWINLEGE